VNETTKSRARRLLRPLVGLLRRLRVAPDAVTLTALPLSVAAGGLFATGRFSWAGVVLALAGVLDVLDGELARDTGRESQTGAVIDSTVDRAGEGLVFAGLFWFYRGEPLYALTAVLALFFSLMVSYVRARAEGAGRECSVGFFDRPVRVVLLLFGAFVLGRTYMPLALAVVAAGGLGTAVHRLLHVVRPRPGNR